MKKTLITLLLSVMTIANWAQQFKVDGIYYNILSETDRTVETTNEDHGTGNACYWGDVVIPEKVVYNDKEYTITGIGYDTFSYCPDVTSIILPETIVSIGGGAFNCPKVTELKIPNSVTYIGFGAFWACSNLTSIVVPEGITTLSRNFSWMQKSHFHITAKDCY